MSAMRAKLRVESVTLQGNSQTVKMCGVGRANGYFLEITVAMPALFNFEPGQKYYLDFTPAEPVRRDRDDFAFTPR